MPPEIEYLPARGPRNQPTIDLTPETTPAPAADGRLFELLRLVVERQASDLHLLAGQPPTLRVNGKLEALAEPRLRGEEIRSLLTEALPQRAADFQGAARDVDGSLTFQHAAGPARFRVNAYRTQGAWSACLRHIATAVPSLAALGFPEAVAQQIMTHRDGLVIFTGATGTGKSSSMAALIQLMAERQRLHVLTVEEPIEFVFNSRSGSLFSQREVGRDVDSFAAGLKYGLRQDPDVILVGETRDRETAQMVLSAAETGHLVLTTLHTRDAKGALTRFVDLFPGDQHEEVRKWLALSLRTVVSQHLVSSTAKSSRRVLATEVLHNTSACEVAIRTGRFETIDSVLQTGRRDGMVTLDDDLARLSREGKIPPDVAQRYTKRG